MSKKDKTPFSIFAESVGLYFSNFSQFVKYMSFPVWGQILGVVLIIGINYLYTQNISKLITKFPSLNDPIYLILLCILVILPGILIYIKAFVDFLIAYGAINSMLDNMLKSGRVYDFEAHTGLVKKHGASFFGLWLLLSIFSIVAILPPFWIICGIFAVYFVLIFQVFTFEAETPIGCFRRSFQLVLRHFGSTFLLIFFAGGLTYLVIPQLMTKACDGLGITVLITNCFKPVIDALPSLELPNIGQISNYQMATIAVQSLIGQIFIQYTLPLRSILWSLWYKELSKNYEPAIKSEKKSRKKRPSEKLMEESHKKYGTKKLDTNILRRAMEKDED